MITSLSRRDFVVGAPGFGVAAALLYGLPVRSVFADEKGAPSGAKLWPEFPSQDPKLVREMVGVCHFDEKRVRELAEQHPALANAAWDWGFGDWETALGAAAHTGRRGIAEALLERGARMDIFAATMLGFTEVVKAMVADRPGIQRTLGPHNIPLLSHAKAGGDAAADTLKYLESLGDAGETPKTTALSREEARACVGRFAFGDDPGDILEVTVEKGELSIVRAGHSSKRLNFVGNQEFFPTGAPGVRIRFEVVEGKAAALTVIDHQPIVRASRVPT